MAQQIIVGIIVAAAAMYAGWRFMPAPWRRGLAQAIGGKGQALGLSEQGARQLTRKLETTGGCGSCDSCGSCKTPAEKEKDGLGRPRVSQ